MITTQVDEIVDQHGDAKRDALIPILQEVQERQGFLSREAMIRIGQRLHLPVSKIYGVATFYNQFRFQPRGQYHVQVCRGTACHVKGSAKVLEAIKQNLKLDAGQTGKDGQFSLEVVACIGACGLAPALCINGEYHAGVTPEKVGKILNSYRGRAQANAQVQAN